MTKEHLEELINGVINHIAVANSVSEQIEELDRMGFTKDDLLYFGYSKEDLKDHFSETFLSLFKELYDDTGIICDENMDLSRLLPSNAMDIAIKVVEEYGYNTNYEDFTWDKVLDMCNDIACEICKIDLADTRKWNDISEVMMKYFFTDYIDSHGYDKNQTMQMVIGECYHEAIANLCTEPSVLEYFKRV